MHYTAQGPMGHYFEDAKEGDVFVTMSRTITEADIVNFGGLIGPESLERLKLFADKQVKPFKPES